MVSKDLIKDKRFDEIERLAREAVNMMLDFKVKHVGINAANEHEAEKIADSYDNIFGFSKKVGNSSIFAGDGIEVMKEPYLGVSRTYCNTN